MEFNVHEAKTQLSKLLDMAQEGESVVITRKGKAVAEVVPARKKGSFPIGGARGTLLTESDEWWQPLSEEELAPWHGK